MDTWYIAIDQSHWGRGRTQAAADAQLKQAGGSKKTRLMYMFTLPAGSVPPNIDGMGNTVYAQGGTRTLIAVTRDYKQIPVESVEH
jgi:hypothetical protein